MFFYFYLFFKFNAGRITKIVDASGERLFEYGKLGETTKETRTLFFRSHDFVGVYRRTCIRK
ncbi:MAG: hypothetical protein PHO65_00530 [Sulfurovum sp.]|nr:hypothetical protein [Sulfurovum sp.]